MTRSAITRWLRNGALAAVASSAPAPATAWAEELDETPHAAPRDDLSTPEDDFSEDDDDGEEEFDDDPSPEPSEDEPDADTAEEALEYPELDPRSQQPTPVALVDRPDPPARFVDAGFFTGYTLRPSDNSLVSYGPAQTWGLYLRPELRSWLGVRLYYRRESIPVTVHRGGLEQADWPLGATDFHQPNLNLRSLGARVEPTWVINPRVRLSGIVGISWLRFVAPEPISRGERQVQTAERSAVELNPVIGASASFDVIPNWLIVTAAFTHGLSVNRSGEVYEPVQAFSEGRRLQLGPLPHFQSVSDALLFIGLLL